MATVTAPVVTFAKDTLASASLSITLPVCTAGQLLVLLVANNISTATPTTPSGWTSTTLTPQNVRADNYAYMFTKTAVSGDSGATLTLTFAAATLAAAVALSASAIADTLTGSSKSTDGTTQVIPAITPSVADCLELGFVCSVTRGGTDTPGITTPAGWTELADTWSTAASGNNLEVALYSKQLVGQAGVAQGTATTTITGNSHSGLMYAMTVAPVAAPASLTHAHIGGSWVSTVRRFWNGTTWA